MECLSILERLNDAACESSVVSEAIESGVSRLIVERVLKPGDSHPIDENWRRGKGVIVTKAKEALGTNKMVMLEGAR